MAIVCGTDSDRRAVLAVDVAALFARRMEASLHLVQDPNPDPVAALVSARELVQRSRQRFEGDVHLHVAPGPFAESLIRIAQRMEATLIAIAVPERVTQAWCVRTVGEIILRANAVARLNDERLLSELSALLHTTNCSLLCVPSQPRGC